MHFGFVTGQALAGNNFWHIIAGAAIGAGMEVAGQLLSGTSPSEINWAKVGVAAVSGGVSAAFPGAGMLVSGMIDGATDLAMDAIDGKVHTVGDGIKSFTWGMAKSVTCAYGGKLIGNALKKVDCFTAGTLVTTYDGKVPIEEIEIGDYVLSSDPETGDVIYEQVIQTYVKETNTVVHVCLESEEEFVTTTTHPFYVENKGWVYAGDLSSKDHLLDDDGEVIEIAEVWIETLDENVLVYNFAVENYHTYYVGNATALVHNQCPIEKALNKISKTRVVLIQQELDDGCHKGSMTR